MAELTYGKLDGMTGSCPICDSDLFWEKTPVRVDALADDRRSADLWPPGSSSWEPVGRVLLECAGCGSQFTPEVLGTAGEAQDIDAEEEGV